MDRKHFRQVNCDNCGRVVNTRKTAGSWLVCPDCSRGIKLSGFSCDYNVRCRVCNKGFSPDTKGSIKGRICPSCRSLGRGKEVKHTLEMEDFSDELEEII